MSRPPRVAVCLPQVPFERGGAEIMCDALVEQLRLRGMLAELVTVPFHWYPDRHLLTNATVWRSLEFTESNGQPIDAVIGTKFPSYLARHPRKVVWLIHQFRQAYDLHGTEYGQFNDDTAGAGMRRAVSEMDKVALGEARAIFTISRNVSARLKKYNGVDSEPLLPPPQQLGVSDLANDGYVLSVGRLDRTKRLDLLIDALGQAPEARAVIVGDGPDRGRLEQRAGELGVADRCAFRGRVDEAALADAYGRAGAVFYAPFDEDYGLVPLEAHLAGKPVISTTDAGGPLDVVHDGTTGRVCAPEPAAIAGAIADLLADPTSAARMGEAGQEFAATITWERAVDTLVGALGL